MNDGQAKTAFIIIMVIITFVCFINEKEPAKPKTKPTTQQTQTVSTVKSPANNDAQLKNRIKGYVDGLSGAAIVIVRGDSANGFIVETDYDFGTDDRETAKSYATNLIHDIVNANGDCTFKYISVNCMNGKSPLGVIVNYEDGQFSTLP